jgi:hypothetical protein
MSDQVSGSEAAKEIGNPFGTFIEWLAGLLPVGPARTLLYVATGLCVLVAPFIYRYYLGVLAQGAAPEGSIERQDFDKLRASLAGGNLAARLYAKWLTAFLDWIERFFGDVGVADRTLFPHAFGLETPVPTWTAPALDRCLLLALIYPIATIFLLWAVSGHVGPAGATLGLQPNISGWLRGFAAAVLVFEYFAVRRFTRAKGLRSLLSSGAISVAPLAFLAVADVRTSITNAIGTVGLISGLALVVFIHDDNSRKLIDTFHGGTDPPGRTFVGSGGGTYAYSHMVTLIAALLAFFNNHDFLTLTVALVVAYVVSGGLTLASAIAIRARRQGIFLALFFALLILGCLGAACAFSPLQTWAKTGPFLLFVGLLTLLNAPFDWASLGLTRALLRRGLELGGWWPYLLALVDAAFAGVIIALLALAMVLGVQTFDELAVHGGGTPVLPLDALFDGIATNPAAPEYWWAYALLLSSMIPSLVNLTIAGTAFTRGIPWLARLLLQWIPEGKAVPDYRRPLAAIGLTTQMFAGVGLGIAAQVFLVWGLIFHVMPWVGLDLLDMARWVAAFDLPVRIGTLFAGAP